jgi:hypothetical protein
MRVSVLQVALEIFLRLPLKGLVVELVSTIAGFDGSNSLIGHRAMRTNANARPEAARMIRLCGHSAGMLVPTSTAKAKMMRIGTT